MFKKNQIKLKRIGVICGYIGSFGCFGWVIFSGLSFIIKKEATSVPIILGITLCLLVMLAIIGIGLSSIESESSQGSQ